MKVYEEMTEEEKEKATSLQERRDVLEHLVEEYARDFKKELLNLFPSLGGRVIKLQKKVFELGIKVWVVCMLLHGTRNVFFMFFI